MDANDIDLARDVFVDLVVAWTIHHRQPPDSGEARRLAEEAIHAARLFGSAGQEDLASETVAASGTASGLPPRGGTVILSQLIRDWGTRIVSRSAGHTGRALVSRLDRYLVPHLGTRPISDLQPAEILSVLRGIENLGFRPLAYQIYRDLRGMYRYAHVAGMCTRDPMTVVGSFMRTPRTRRSPGIFHPERLGQLLVAIRSYQGKARSTTHYMFRLAPILFLRAVELRELEWREVDLHAATLVISPERMKSRHPHIVPLPIQAVRILREVHKITSGSRFVFNAGRGRDRPPSFTVFYQMLRRIGYARTVTAQGFRAMASTWLNEQGWRADAIEKQLSHLGGGWHSTRRVYNRAEYLAERRKMMQAWADYLTEVELRTRRSLRKTGLVEGKVWRGGATDVAIRY
jgi:integrase